MRENISNQCEGGKVIPYKERMDHEFEVFCRKYLPEKPTPADLTMGTIAYINDRGLKPNDPADKPKVNKIIKEFNTRFFEKYTEFGAPSPLTTKQKSDMMRQSKNSDMEIYSRTENKD